MLAELAPGGRLADIADLLQSAGAMPLTLEVGPETLESWDALAQADARLGTGVASVKAAVERTSNQLLPAPYVPIDLTSLEAAGLGAQLPDQLRTGSSTLDQITGVSPDTRTAFVDPIDAATLARAYAACSSTASSCARRRSRTSRVRTRSPRSR